MKEFKAVKEDLGLDELGKLFAPLSPRGQARTEPKIRPI